MLDIGLRGGSGNRLDGEVDGLVGELERFNVAEGVGAVAAAIGADGVATTASGQRVVDEAAAEVGGVGSTTAVDAVVTGAADEAVVAGVAGQCIITGRATERFNVAEGDLRRAPGD